jgi:muramoyltetrapeptide carboxypeptidase
VAVTTALRWPPPLRPGDEVVALAPGGPVDRERAAAGVALLERWGLRVRVAEHAFARHPSGFLAAGDGERAADLQAALDDPDVAGVFCLRGGYGAQRLLPLLDLDRVARAPKAFVGFSDVTVLHAALQRAGLVTFHGPSLQWDARRLPGASARSLEAAVTGRPSERLRGEPLAPGRVTAPIVGGNLTLLAHLCGTPHEVRAAGCVLLLEDVAERPYRLDGALVQLRQAGVLDRVRGLALGTFHDCVETRGARPSASALAVLAGWADELGVPAVWDLPLGHGHGQRTVALGAPATLDGDAGTLDPPSAPAVP